jgi:hypothetical protein
MTNEHDSHRHAGQMSRLDVDRFLMRHGVFIRGARDAARQALFFLDTLAPCDKSRYQGAIRTHWKPALHQARGLIRGVYVPTVYEVAAQSPERKTDERVERALRSVELWRQLAAQMERAKASEEHSAPLLAETHRLVERFLVESRIDSGNRKADSLAARLSSHYVDNVAKWFRRHLSLILAVALLLGVSLRVEAVHGLLGNEGAKLLLYIVLLPLPAYLHLRRLRRLFRRKGPVHPWDLGRLAFWRIRPLAEAPRRLIPRWPAESGLLGKIGRAQLIRVTTYLVCAALAVAGLYWLSTALDSASWSSPPTVPIILWIFFAILLAADQLDLWDFLLPQPVRLTTLLIIVVALLGTRVGWGLQAFAILFFLAALVLGIVYLGGARRSYFQAGLAVVCLVVGLGLLRALWTTEHSYWRRTSESSTFTPIAASEWPYTSSGKSPVVVMAASGGGSRAAVYTALTLERLEAEYGEISRELQLISSVSGGSLANAAYLARRAGCGQPGPTKKLVDAMKEDFLLPTLAGALIPGKSRGDAIKEAWQSGAVGLGDCSLKDVAVRWRASLKRGDDFPPFPLPMFNTTTLDGHDVVISPLAKEHYIQSRQRRAAELTANPILQADPDEDDVGPFTWVYFRDGIYSLEDFLDNQDVTFSSAVLASANFPFGFPVVRLALEPAADSHRRRLIFSPVPKDPELIKLTDGGALSNSGMWSLFQLLVNRRDELYDRGVLLIVVEASKMPSYEGFSGTVKALMGAIKDQGGISRNLHQRMLDTLALYYGDRLATVQLDLIPREEYNVYTTWALDRTSIGKIEESFETRWKEEVCELSAKWEFLKNLSRQEIETPAAPFCMDLIDRRRPPLD